MDSRNSAQPIEVPNGNPSRRGKHGWGPGVPRGGALSSKMRRVSNLLEDDNFVRVKKVAAGRCALLSGEGHQEFSKGLCPGSFGALFRRVGAASQSHGQWLVIAINFPAPSP
jgi:hypothetical protein